MNPVLTELEKAVLPLAAPLLQGLWTSTILPEITAKLKSASPEIQLLESQFVALLTNTVPPLLTKLGTL
jgi:hypothetical protein